MNVKSPVVIPPACVVIIYTHSRVVNVIRPVKLPVARRRSHIIVNGHYSLPCGSACIAKVYCVSKVIAVAVDCCFIRRFHHCKNRRIRTVVFNNRGGGNRRRSQISKVCLVIPDITICGRPAVKFNGIVIIKTRISRKSVCKTYRPCLSAAGIIN